MRTRPNSDEGHRDPPLPSRFAPIKEKRNRKNDAKVRKEGEMRGKRREERRGKEVARGEEGERQRLLPQAVAGIF